MSSATYTLDIPGGKLRAQVYLNPGDGYSYLSNHDIRLTVYRTGELSYNVSLNSEYNEISVESLTAAMGEHMGIDWCNKYLPTMFRKIKVLMEIV